MTWSELVSKRTQTAKHFAKANSTRRVFQQVMKTPLHYHNHPDGSGYDNEVDLRQDAVDVADLDGFSANRAKIHFDLGHMKHNHAEDGWFAVGGRNGESNIGLRLNNVGLMDWRNKEFTGLLNKPSYDRKNLTFEPNSVTLGVEDHRQAVHAGNIVTWSNLWPGVSMRWLIDGRKVKTEVEFDPTARAKVLGRVDLLNHLFFTLIFKLELGGMMGRNGIAWLKQGGQAKNPTLGFDDLNGQDIWLTDADDRALGFMPLDRAYSERYEVAPGRFDQDEIDLVKRIYVRNGQTFLMVGARVPQINGMHAGSVVFDPTFEDQPDGSAGKDTFIESSAPTTVRGTSIRLRTDTGAKHSLLEFDTSSIDSDATCDSATLSLWSEDSAAGVDSYDIYSLASGVDTWVENQATWNNYKSGTSWPGSSGAQTSGTDYEAGSLGSISYPLLSAGTEATASLTASRIEGWFGATNTNYGLLIGITGSTDLRDWKSSDASASGDRPKISIEYSTGVVVIPAAASAIGARANPTFLAGNLLLSSLIASAVGQKVDPTVVSGDLSLTPAEASAIGDKVDPTVQITGGGISVSPDAASAIGQVVAPTVIKGNLLLSNLIASAIGAVVDPSVVKGNLLLNNLIASAIGAVIDPTVQIAGGGTLVTPGPASAIGQVVAPSVVKGSLLLSNLIASAIGAVVDPTVQIAGGGTFVTPNPASAIGQVVAPTVIKGSLLLTNLVASAIGQVVAPTVIEGNLLLSNLVASAIGAIVDPSVQITGGGISVSPDAASAIGQVVNPTPVTGSLILVPDPAAVVGRVVAPSVAFSSLVFTPNPASVVGQTVAPTVLVTGGNTTVIPNPASVVGLAILGLVVVSGVRLLDVTASDAAKFIVIVSDKSRS